MKIGLIQVQRFGDLMISLPIAAWFIARGHAVYWPVGRDYYAYMQAAAPNVHFLPLDGEPDPRNPLEFFYHRPHALLRELGCDLCLPLYYYLEGGEFIDRKLLGSLKFDEYKYAYAGVPFAEKWNLRLVRDPGREKALHRMLNITRPYICVHRIASNAQCDGHIATGMAGELSDRRTRPADRQPAGLDLHDRACRQAGDDR